LEVDSVYEVHDYIKSYLGEGKAAHDFAKQFLERRQKLKPPSQQVKRS
jgi:PERQ amino acid-rich with GYF domain-containing protein